ncbi:MAG: hypothetical protein MJY83_01995 [Bacteroidales bacterium]|nr:hypothetical protein [Bacteroidales bacterium]
MKLNRFAIALLASACAVIACKKVEPEPDVTPAELKSFSFLAADNSAYIDKDVVAEIADHMVVRITEGGKGKTLVATLTAGENDEITVNDKLVPATGKISVDATYPIDIVVKNTGSGLSAAYEVKVGKILEVIMTKVAAYTHAGATSMDKDFNLMINPTNDVPYLVYDRKVDGQTKSNTSIATFEGGAFTLKYDALGDNATTHCYPVSATFAADGTPYVLMKGGESASTSMLLLKRLSGADWQLLNPEFTQKLSFSFGNPVLFTSGNYVGCFGCGNDKTITETYRMNAGFLWNGSWGTTNLALPAYGAKGGSDGMFYMATPVVAKDVLYLITSCNLYGHYMFKFNNGSWEKVVDNFIPEGEEYGIPTNLQAVSNAEGEIFFLASHSKNPALQVYKFDSAAASFAPYANLLPATAASAGSIAEKMAIGLNPTNGQIVGVKDNEAGNPCFSFIKDGKWADFVVADDIVSATKYEIRYDSKGNGYCATVNKADNSIVLYQIGLEADILPE